MKYCRCLLPGIIGTPIFTFSNDKIGHCFVNVLLEYDCYIRNCYMLYLYCELLIILKHYHMCVQETQHEGAC